MTPGRELAVAGDESDGYDVNVDKTGDGESETESLARRYIGAIGGSDNLTGIDYCITGLRLNVKDSAQVNESVAKRLGASGVIRLNKQSVQVIVGTQAESIASAMKKLLTKGPVASAGSATAAPVASVAKPQTVLNSEKRVIATLVAPVSGDVFALDSVPDEAFASKAVGQGLAIKPTGKTVTVVAPIAGTLVKIFATNHAFCLETSNGVEIGCTWSWIPWRWKAKALLVWWKRAQQ